MHVIDKEEERDYALLMDKVAYCGYLESGKAVKNMNLEVAPTDLRELSEAIGMAVGQIVLDKVIELTKNMDRDKLVRYFAQTAFSHTIEVMNGCPEYRKKIQVLGPFLDHI
jgi:hypothetical protein